MRVSQAQPLAAFFRQLDSSDWTSPKQTLEHAALDLRRITPLAKHVGHYLGTLPTDDLADLARRAHDGPTRFDLMLHRPPSGTFECGLHVTRRIFSDSVASRPYMNRKGHWLLTVVLSGRMVIRKYRFSGFGDPDSFADVQLDVEGEQEYTAGQSFILHPLQIHQIAEVVPATATLSIRPTTEVGPMRIYHRNLQCIVTEDLVPMPQRVLDLARNLARTSTPS